MVECGPMRRFLSFSSLPRPGASLNNSVIGRLMALRTVMTVATVGSILLGPDAQAYCRTTYCPDINDSWHACTPASPDDCGLVLYWFTPCVSYSIQKDASKYVSFAQTEEALKTAFATWTHAACSGGGTPRIRVTEGKPVDCHRHEFNKCHGNANIVMFQDAAWPHKAAGSTLALTTVTYRKATGEILDADLEINSFGMQNELTLGDTNVGYDLLSIVTHETGHFLGLEHSPNLSATMFYSASGGTLSHRNIDADDVAGICAIYPPGTIPAACNDTPTRGFLSECANEPPDDAGLTCEVECAADLADGGVACSTSSASTGSCCTVAPGRTAPGGASALAIAALGSALLAARRREHGETTASR